MAAPTVRTDAIVDEIIERLAKGEPLAVICRSPGMPDRRTVNRWREADEALDSRFLDARDDGYDVIAGRARQTARGGADSSGDVQRDKLIIETDLKLLAKWDRRRYGDRVTLAGDKENPLGGMTTEQIDARLRELGVDPERLG